jgi:single-stranded DNA-specific DHH superfamily exonuclease
MIFRNYPNEKLKGVGLAYVLVRFLLTSINHKKKQLGRIQTCLCMHACTHDGCKNLFKTPLAGVGVI